MGWTEVQWVERTMDPNQWRTPTGGTERERGADHGGERNQGMDRGKQSWNGGARELSVKGRIQPPREIIARVRGSEGATSGLRQVQSRDVGSKTTLSSQDKWKEDLRRARRVGMWDAGTGIAVLNVGESPWDPRRHEPGILRRGIEPAVRTASREPGTSTLPGARGVQRENGERKGTGCRTTSSQEERRGMDSERSSSGGRRMESSRAETVEESRGTMRMEKERRKWIRDMGHPGVEKMDWIRNDAQEKLEVRRMDEKNPEALSWMGGSRQ
jgi:hypothetical protein